MPTNIATTDQRPKRGRPHNRLALPSERPKVLRLPFCRTEAEPTPERQAALVRFLTWISCAETAGRPEDRLDALEHGLAALQAAGVSARELAEAAR